MRLVYNTSDIKIWFSEMCLNILNDLQYKIQFSKYGKLHWVFFVEWVNSPSLLSHYCMLFTQSTLVMSGRIPPTNAILLILQLCSPKQYKHCYISTKFSSLVVLYKINISCSLLSCKKDYFINKKALAQKWYIFKCPLFLNCLISPCLILNKGNQVDQQNSSTSFISNSYQIYFVT